MGWGRESEETVRVSGFCEECRKEQAISERVTMVSQQSKTANLELISAVSWDGNQSDCRGAAGVGSEGMDHLDLAGRPSMYLSDQAAEMTRNGWPTEDAVGIVMSYDPARDAIVIVGWLGEVGTCRFQTPTPHSHYGLMPHTVRCAYFAHRQLPVSFLLLRTSTLINLCSGLFAPNAFL